jgi:Fis family transcriptional regulator, factor for inversion stimulation protein
MPSYQADKPGEYQSGSAPRPHGLSVIDRDCIRQLVGHTLAMVEREFILQTLRNQHGNRTRAANLLCISIRSLRDRIRSYRDQGESVPEPMSVHSSCPTAHPLRQVHH